MLCHNKWLSIDWDGRPARLKHENLNLTFHQRAKAVKDFDSACDLVAEEIGDCFKNLYVALSGGSDSEYVATCLTRNNIPFTPLLIDYKKYQVHHPQYELWYAYQWCKTHGVVPKVFELDLSQLSQVERSNYDTIKPRLPNGNITSSLLHQVMDELEGNLVTGSQLEYYPDHEQMTYLEPQLGDYKGFVVEESDIYLEMIEPSRHPWAFFYWSPEILSSFVNAWNTELTMQENKVAIYKTSPRPKFGYSAQFFTEFQHLARINLAKKWGTRDCALLGTKEHILSQLLE